MQVHDEPNKYDKKDVWIVIPAYREGAIISSTVDAVLAEFPNVVVVDDGSPDDTGEKALEAGAIVVAHPVNLGQGAAIQTGMEFALQNGAQLIVTFDADGQHRIQDVQMMLDTLVAGGHDVILSSRFLGRTENLPLARRLLLRLAVFFTNMTCGIRLTDTHNGLRAFTAYAARQIDIKQNGMAHASEIIEQIGRLKLDFKEVPVTILYTEYSLQKGQKISNSFRILSDILLGWMFK